MTCDDAIGELHARLDGSGAGDGRALAEHLASCASCRALEEDLRRLRAAAAELPPEIPPSRDLWPGIAARIGRPRASGWRGPGMWLAATALVAVGSSALTAAWLRSDDPPPPVSVAWDRDLDRACDELRAAVEARRDELDPETLALVEENLRIVDRAVAETRAALAADPNNADLQKSLADVGEQRLALLRLALDLAS